MFVLHITDNKGVFGFANAFQTIGFFVGFLLSLFTCTSVKTYVYFGLCVLSLICYILLIFRENKHKINEINLKLCKQNSNILLNDTNPHIYLAPTFRDMTLQQQQQQQESETRTL